MITENLSTLKIHKLTQAQYDRELEAGRIDENALYLTPDEDVDLSGYATIEQINSKSDIDHNHDDAYYTQIQVDTLLSNKAASSHNHSASNITSGTLSSDRLSTIPVAKGGTGATTAAAALTNLGLTATATELNKMDGVTATTTEINYLDGVTSNIQTQLDGKAASNHTHSEYASSSHTHDEYASADHTHSEYMTTANPVGTDSFSMNRKSGTTVGSYSSTLGRNCEASGKYSHAEGNGTVASGDYSHAEGYALNYGSTTYYASGKGSHVEGSNTEASGDYSHAEGGFTKARGYYSHAEGNLTEASCAGSHAEGYSTTVTTDSTVEAKTTTDYTVGNYGHAEGYGTVSYGMASHAEGHGTKASGHQSHAEGMATRATGTSSHAEGHCTIAANWQHASGKYNTGKTAPSSSETQDSTHADAIFMIGCGTSSAAKNAFRVSSGGKCYGSTAFGASGADFAELFEWADGNPNNEDRRGLFVALDGEKIKLANAEDDYIGVISGAQAFIGNSASEEWQGKYLTDVFGTKLSQEVEIPEEVDESTGEVIRPATVTIQYVLNPDYNPNEEYIMRENRKEWGIVGLLGQIVMIDDGTCVVGGRVEPSVNGIGTASDKGYRVMKRIDENHIKVLVK
jgi:hypothetical protein